MPVGGGHQDVSRLGDLQGLVQHEIVPGMAADGDGRAQQAEAPGQGLDARVHRAGAPGRLVYGGDAQSLKSFDQLPLGLVNLVST
jgi:hypothetical protein